MSIKNSLLTLIIVLLFAVKVNASHILGSEIYYEHVKDSTYDFYIKVYRDCYALNFTIVDSTISLYCASSGKSVYLDMNKVSVKEITTKCSSAASECTPLDSVRSGKGVEEYLFKTRVDFGSSKYSSLASCSKLELRFKGSLRSGFISTGPSSTLHCNYLRMDIDNFKDNSSPQFTHTPVTRLSPNHPTYLNFGAADGDGDSLSYHMAPALVGFFKSATYSSKFSAQKPVTVYDPGNRGWVRPFATLPIGFYLDSTNGQIIFTPTSMYQVPIIVVEVKEWRKNKSGNYKLIGSIFRELIPTINSYSPNIGAVITNTKTTYNICEGDSFQLDLRSKDYPYSGQKVPDTTVYLWDQSIPDASLVTIKDTLADRNGIFTWNTKAGDAREKPYVVRISVSDSSCPLPSFTTKYFTINVAKAVKPKIVKHRQVCNEFKLKVKSESSWHQPSVIWRVYDTLGKRISDKTIVSFTGQLDSSNADSTNLSLYQPGKYVVAVDYVTGGCTNTLFDTIVYSGKLDLIVSNDTILCSDNQFVQHINPVTISQLASWKWFWLNDSITNDSFSSTSRVGNNKLKVRAVANDGCVRVDSLFIKSVYKPKLKAISDTLHCATKPLNIHSSNTNDSGLINTQFLWSNGSKSSSATIDSTGQYWVTAQNQCGQDSVHFKVTIDTVFTFSLGNDKLLCDTNAVKIGRQRRSQTSYLWNTGDTASQIIAKSNGLYSIAVTSPCVSHKDTILVSFDKTPSPLDWEEYILYCDVISDTFDAENPGFTYLWDDGSTKQTKTINSPGWHKVVVSSKHCGQITDSSYAVFVKTPDVFLGKDTGVAKPVNVLLDAGDHTNAKYIWNTGDSSRTIQATDFGNYWVKVTNVCGVDVDSIDILDKANIEPLRDNFISVYPNPSDGQFAIKGLASNYILNIFDIHGRKVYYNTTTTDGTINVDLVEALPGVYTVVSSSSSKTVVFKIVLE